MNLQNGVMLLAHGGRPGGSTAADYIVMGFGVALAALGIVFLRKPRTDPTSTRIGKMGSPLILVGLLTMLLGPSLLPATGGACSRPATNASVSVESPKGSQVFQTTQVPVEVKVSGAKLSQSASTKNTSNEGHLHLTLDGRLVSMTGTSRQVIEAQAGKHQLTAELVANDHAPFCTRVTDRVRFEVAA